MTHHRQEKGHRYEHFTKRRDQHSMTTLPGQNDQTRVYPVDPVQITSRLIEEGNVCGACGDWVSGGADPTVMALHLCEPEEGVGIEDTQTGQGVL